MKSKINDDFLKAIEDSYKNYLSVHARSNKKIIPIHSFIANKLKEILGGEYEIKSLGYDTGKEYKFQGFFYNKNIDI